MVINKPHAGNLRKDRNSLKGQFYFLTTTIADRRDLFIERDNALIVLNALRWLDDQKRLIIDAAVVMPDHLHVAGTLGDSTLQAVMHSLKSYTGRRLAQAGIRTPVWHRGYYDHALRNDDDYRVQVEYLLNNPVRAGLVEKARDYPYLIFPSWFV